jgi:hypothetical protein
VGNDLHLGKLTVENHSLPRGTAAKKPEDAITEINFSRMSYHGAISDKGRHNNKEEFC